MTTPAPGQQPTARLEADLPTLQQPRRRDAQYAPGTMVAGRYRIAGLLGAGGMGEVYRADDTKLGQQVALKFLPARLERDATLLSRLHEEVRLGRQVTHPNVCRLYDIVEWEGAHFVAMEYVDGEDLGRLLRRIGRLAHDKAVEMGRGIAAGLAAAHAKGILHRDLKPANIMIDSHGEARIMDFGLALDDGEDDGTISGTPAYMAPEQLEGQPATIQSDLYALGLVLYELFTGRRAHNARTLPERVRDSGSEITTPSSLIKEMDPAVERMILRCLASDPAQRPRSAREVAAALPGADPLAAALLAGETPSPRVVAAAGSEGTLSRRAAWSLLGTFALLIALAVIAERRLTPANVVPFERSPEVLRQRAGEVLRSLGVPADGEPIAAFRLAETYMSWLEARGGRWWETYRRGPAPIHYRLEYGMPAAASRVVPHAAAAPGWTSADIDPHGRLTYLLAPPAAGSKPRALDWQPLLAAAGFDAKTLRPAAPRDTPAVSSDTRAAWTGTYPGDATPVRIEAAAWRGTPVYLRLTGPWDGTAPGPLGGFGGPALHLFFRVLTFTVFGAAFFLAWRNMRMRRGDRQGALRVAAVLFVAHALARILLQPWHAPGSTMAELARIVGEAMVSAAVLYVAYIALEPYARRRWPELLIAWARLISGRARDPLVGRHVLIGLAAGAAHAALSGWSRIVATWLGSAEPGVMFRFHPIVLNGTAATLGNALGVATAAVSQGFTLLMFLVVMTIIFRKRAIGAALLFAMTTAFFIVAVSHDPRLMPLYLVVAALMAWVAVRFGLLASMVMHATFTLMLSTPAFAGPSWIMQLTVIPLLAVAAAAIWAFRTSLGGQTAFAPAVLDD